MYPVDVSQLARRATLGARITDPTIPHRPSRFARLRQRLRTREQTLANEACTRARPQHRAQTNSSLL